MLSKTGWTHPSHLSSALGTGLASGLQLLIRVQNKISSNSSRARHNALSTHPDHDALILAESLLGNLNRPRDLGRDAK